MSKKEPIADQPSAGTSTVAADEQANVTMAAVSFEHHVTIGRTAKLAEQIALSILRSPHAERFLAGNPIDGHRIDGQSVGAYLAGRSYDLATDFATQIEAFSAEHLRDLIDAQALADAITAAKAPASVEQIHDPD